MVHLQRTAHLRTVTIPAQASDVGLMAPRLRWEDVREIQTLSADDIPLLLLTGIEQAHEAVTLCEDEGGMPIALFGVTESQIEKGCGTVWLVGTRRVTEYRRDLLVACKQYRDRWIEKYPGGLHNFIDSRNLLHLRWLSLLGFKFGRSVFIGDVEFVFAHYSPEGSRKCVTLPQSR